MRSDRVADATSSTAPALGAAALRRTAWTCAVGSALEYYDFAMYSLASALVFGPVFFPGADRHTALLASFGTYFVGFAVRPIGGIFFGALGDKVGRKTVLIITIVLMGLASTGIGLIPGYNRIGVAAPLLLIALRILQGLGAGAEQAGAAVMMTECAPPNRRGLYAALPFLGVQIGTILAAVVYLGLMLSVRDVATSWLWRVPFLLSALILLVALYFRLRLKESPTFSAAKAHHELDQSFRQMVRHGHQPMIVGFGLRMAENGGSSIYQTLAISYVVATVGLPGRVSVISLIFAAVIGAFTIVVAGLLSDRFGRKPTYRAFAILQAVLCVPVWYALSLGDFALTVIALGVILGIATWGMFGVQGALMPELFGVRHRYSGVSVTREISAVFSGGIAPTIGAGLIAWVAARHAGEAHPGLLAWIPLCIYALGLSLITVAATFWLPETRGRDLSSVEDALPVPHSAS